MQSLQQQVLLVQYHPLGTRPKSILSKGLAASALILLVMIGEAEALFGFGRQSSDTVDSSSAKARAVALIKENTAADNYLPPALGVGRNDAAMFTAARASGSLACVPYFPSMTVSWDMVNDDFCDCEDGSDEPGTSACSNGMFECANRGHRPLRLPSSRVGDGVCDCCDGSDESEGRCEPSCDGASEAWVTRLADRIVKAERGAARREDYVQQAAQGATKRSETMEETRVAAEQAREKLAEAQEDLKLLEKLEAEVRSNKLMEAEKAIHEGTGSALDPERATALAVAVASAGEPSVVLARVCRAVLDGQDVGAVLKGLLDDGKTVDQERSEGKAPPIDESDEFLEGEDDEYDGYHDMDNFDDMQLEADFGYGDYGGYGYDDDLRFGGEDVGLDMETQDDEHAPVPVPVLNAQGVDDVGSREGDDRTERQPEEEEEQQRVDEGREDNEPFKPPQQFKSFKFELPDAVHARKAVKDLGSDVKLHEKKLKNLGEEASADYGPDGALWPLKDTCVSTKTGGYEYHVCPFKDAHQQERSSKTLIGKWKGLERAGSDTAAGGPTDDAVTGGADNHNLLLSGLELVFERGQKCWNGPARSLRVALACGPEDVLSAVTEPETCTYTAILETPAACSASLRDDLVASARGSRDGDYDSGDVELRDDATSTNEL